MIDTSPLDRHERIALSVSGGKDSLACVLLLREYLPRMTLYHLDTGDLLPEVREIVRWVEGFAPVVRVQTDVLRWIAEVGYPSDLVPHSMHHIGRQMAENGASLVGRYDCCALNLMLPLYNRIKADGNTLLIRGSKAVDMKRLPLQDGGTDDGIEIWLPIVDWSNADVMAYLREQGAPICRVYETMTNAPECARCTAWWGEGRNAYLKRHHPELWRDYQARMAIVAREISGPMRNFVREYEGAL